MVQNDSQYITYKEEFSPRGYYTYKITNKYDFIFISFKHEQDFLRFLVR